jgi:hypothetical protein
MPEAATGFSHPFARLEFRLWPKPQGFCRFLGPGRFGRLRPRRQKRIHCHTVSHLSSMTKPPARRAQDSSRPRAESPRTLQTSVSGLTYTLDFVVSPKPFFGYSLKVSAGDAETQHRLRMGRRETSRLPNLTGEHEILRTALKGRVVIGPRADRAAVYF